MADLNTIDALEARNAEIETSMTELSSRYADNQPMSEDDATQWNALGTEREANSSRVAEIRQEVEDRRATVAAFAAANPEAREAGAPQPFNTRKSGTVTGEDIYDLRTVRSHPSDRAAYGAEMRDRSMRALERMEFAHPLANQNEAKTHVERLLRSVSDEESPSVQSSAVSERILATDSPAYGRAFRKIISGRQAALTPDEHAAAERAFSIASTGNYPVPVTLDPTLIKVSNGSVNPLRAISRVEQITGNTWKGVTAAGITASYVAESTAATDNTPTLAQPELNVEKAHAFVPFTFEAGQDWGALQASMAELFADAKDDLEATQFVTGAGHGSNAPQGIITGATTTTTAGGTAAFAVADVYKLLEALPARFRARARFLGALQQYDRVRQFDTAGGASLWKYLEQGAGENADGNIGTLVGKPAHEASAMSTVLTTGAKILAFGDFRHYLIVDRIGMDIEYVPHLFDQATALPNGTRGLYAHWRNTAEVLSANAFRVLVTG